LIKRFILFAVFLICISAVNAKRFSAGTKGFNLGAGFDLTDPSPAVHFSGEVGVIPIPNAGTISFGGSADINFVDFSDVRTYLAFRAAFHFGFLKTEKYDVYAGLGTGIRLYDHNKNSSVYFDEFIGARMKLKENFGLFLESGYGPTNIKFGVTWVL